MKTHIFVVRIETEDDYNGLTTAELQSEIQSNLEDVLRVYADQYTASRKVEVELMSITVRSKTSYRYLPARHPKRLAENEQRHVRGAQADMDKLPEGWDR